MRLLLLNLNYLRYHFYQNHAELLKLQKHLHHAELQTINTEQIAANLG